MALILGVLLAAIGVADLVRRPGPCHSWLVRPAWAALLVLIFGLALVGAQWNGLWLVPAGFTMVVAWLAAQRASSVFGLGSLGVLVLIIIGWAQYIPLQPAPMQSWYDSLEVPGLTGVPLGQGALGAGVVLFLLQSSNVVVRAVLGEAGPQVLAVEDTLKGGRIIGPLERVFIFVLALAGQYGAAAAIMAAKGIVRFPEISRGSDKSNRAEYFLVGTFASWSLSLGFVLLF